nr:AMP-binding protein [Gordonia soli]
MLAAIAESDTNGLYHENGFVSWREHLRRSDTRARALRGLLAPDRPAHVGLLLENVPEFSYLVVAAVLGRSVVVGLNTTRRGGALAADIALAECQVVVVEAATRDLLSGIDLPGVQIVDIDDDRWSELLATAEVDVDSVPGAGANVGAGRSSVTIPTADPDDLLMLIFTSGTTGDPKAVRCTHRTFTGAGRMLADRFGIGSSDTVYLSMPMFHSNAMIAGWSVAVAGGASVALRRRFSASAFLADVRRHGVTYANYVGKPLNYILATEERADDADNPLRIVYGNEASARDRRRFADRFGCTVVDGFGSTEGGVAITRTPDTPDDALGPLRPPNAIIDVETGDRLPSGRIGEIVNLSGPGLFSGYHRDEASTADRLRDGIYHTGDLGWVDDDGYVHFAGRLGDWLRVDGENLGTGPIERILVRHPAVRQAAVYGVPVEIGDEVAAVLVTDGIDPEEFSCFLGAQTDLGPKQWPHRVRLVDSLPDTATFKTVKRELRQDDTPFTWYRESGTQHFVAFRA